jgi:peptide/nickel transport system substrate-binding protein
MSRAAARAMAARAFAVAAAFGCSAGCASGADDSEFPRAQTLYLGGRQWGEPSSFNPLFSSPDFPVSMNLVYETLLVFNAPAGRLEPLLAESYRVREDAIEITLNPAARWNDGTKVTADDVKYTFDLGQKYKSIPVAILWQHITGVRIASAAAGTAGPSRTVEFILDKQRRNPLIVLDGLATLRVVPRHSIEPLLDGASGDLEAFNKLRFDGSAVTSGPYRLHSYGSEKIVLIRDDHYWGNAALHGGALPAPRFIIHPIYKSNDHFSVALQQGRLDISTTFIPRIWLKAKKGVRAWLDQPPYFQAAAIPLLYVNVVRRPLDDVHLRRAMGFAINYTDIRELAVSGYSEPLRPGLILPFGVEAKYFSEEDALKYGTTYDPARARAELQAGGYTSAFNDRGELLSMTDARGQRVPTLFVKSPTGWSDYEAVVRIVVRSLRAAGIDARERFVDASLFYPAWLTGDFDLLMNLPSPSPAPSKPWSRFEALLSGRDWAPEGQKMYNNQGRFNDPDSTKYIPRINELLESIPAMPEGEGLISAYRELNRLVMEQQPVLPLVYRPDQFYEFNERHWTGFPTAKNPFLPSQMPGDGPGTFLLWALKPVVAN